MRKRGFTREFLLRLHVFDFCRKIIFFVCLKLKILNVLFKDRAARDDEWREKCHGLSATVESVKKSLATTQDSVQALKGVNDELKENLYKTQLSVTGLTDLNAELKQQVCTFIRSSKVTLLSNTGSIVAPRVGVRSGGEGQGVGCSQRRIREAEGSLPQKDGSRGRRKPNDPEEFDLLHARQH